MTTKPTPKLYIDPDAKSIDSGITQTETMSSTNTTPRDSGTTMSGTTATPRQPILNGVEKWWSPELERLARGRGHKGKVKIRSLDGGKRRLRGGDFLTIPGSLMTLGVAWKSGNKQYGLTTAHGFFERSVPVGTRVRAYDSDEACVKRKEDGKKAHKTRVIGTVVSLDTRTDSAIIEIYPHVEIHDRAVALSSDDSQVHIINVVPDAAAVPPDFGERLYSYGAAYRGMIGVRVDPESTVENLSRQFAVQSFVTHEGKDVAMGETNLTIHGDSGALSLDQYARAWYMNTTLGSSNDKHWSRGVHLRDVANAHPFFFGILPGSAVSSESSFSFTAIEFKEAEVGFGDGKYPLADFSDCGDDEDRTFSTLTMDPASKGLYFDYEDEEE